MTKQSTISTRLGAAAATAALFIAFGSPVAAQQMERLQLGSLVCEGDGGWGAIVTSRREFTCTFGRADGSTRGSYLGVIERFGLDIGVTGDTTLVWVVFGPEGQVEGEFTPGSLAGQYGGVGAEASVGVGIGANFLLGRGESSFALQPVSLQVQTGISIAAGVQTLTLTYVGPIE